MVELEKVPYAEVLAPGSKAARATRIDVRWAPENFRLRIGFVFDSDDKSLS